MHPRVALHHHASGSESTTAFIDHCRDVGVAWMTLATPRLMEPGGVEEVQTALTADGPRVECLAHPFALSPDLEQDEKATERLIQAIHLATALDATSIYMTTGGRGSLSWEAAAERFAELIAPCRPVAEDRGVKLLVETASSFNAHIHIAHTLADTITLAEMADIGVCIDLHACWFEGGLTARLRRAVPTTGLVQVSDYVLGDRTAPCRAVPGDGVIPLERILGELLSAGYAGVFDLELLGPRVEAEGVRTATTRGAEALSELLTKLGG